MKYLHLIILFLCSLSAMLVLVGCKADADDFCSEISCSNHGTCVIAAGEPTCACNEGYRPDGLNCLLENQDAQDSFNSSDAEVDEVDREDTNSSDVETDEVDRESTDSDETTDVSDSTNDEDTSGLALFGEHCEEAQDCESGLCTLISEELTGSRCTQFCIDACPDGWRCDTDPGGSGPDAGRVCIPDSCTDEDGDHYGLGPACLEEDCDDTDANINPGITEDGEDMCDNLDNDCDGAIDEELSRPCYNGLPGTELVGICHGGVEECSQGEWGECSGQQLPEQEGFGINCFNDLDDDCDEIIDLAEEECVCVPEETPNRECYSGPSETEGVGICLAGEQDCLPDNQWEETCDDQITPQDESCNNMGSDDNCDGVDDNIPDFGDDCDTGLLGVCAQGVWECDGEFLMCTSIQQPSEEICDDLDNNCDGRVDENCPCIYDETDNPTQDCYSGPNGTADIGICRRGTKECQLDYFWGPCQGEQLPQEEVCDGADNNCDGETDEDLGETTCGQGPCEHSSPNCLNGVTQECDPFEGSGDEVCDGTDNDCNGETDEDFNLTDDPANCGECGVECSENELCVSGSCGEIIDDSASCSSSYCIADGSFVNFSSHSLESESYQGSSQGGQILTTGEMNSSRYKIFLELP